MDFVFFAFSSLSAGFIILLLSLVSGRSGRVLAWRYLIFSVVVSILYYTLLASYAREQLLTYYFLTLTPHVLLMLLLSVVFWRSKKQGSS